MIYITGCEIDLTQKKKSYKLDQWSFKTDRLIGNQSNKQNHWETIVSMKSTCQFFSLSIAKHFQQSKMFLPFALTHSSWNHALEVKR